MDRHEWDITDVCFNSHSEHFDQVAFDLFDRGVLQGDQAAYREWDEYMDYYYDIDVDVEYWDEFYPPS